jgi:predicted amidohydrolase YtcJ
VTADLILRNGLITTLDRANPAASAVAITDGVFTAVGRDGDVMPLAGPSTRIIDLRARRVLPGLIDNHLHIIRGGLNFNMELRWDGVRSLADAMAMLKRQVVVTPPPQWVRVVGGFTAHQFIEKRLPTLEEINAAAPETPVFLLHLYDRALLNGAALRAVGYTKDTPDPPAGELVRDTAGNPTGLLLAKPNAGILYATLAKGPKLPFEYQLNSTRHFMRELNGLGVTGAIDAGGGFQNYPEDYSVIHKLSEEGKLTIRLAYNLFTQKPKAEKTDFLNWTRTSKYKQGETTSDTTAPARCWSSRRPISRTFASRAPTCRRKWRASSRWWCGFWPRTVGHGGCMRPTMRPFRERSMCSSGSIRIFRFTG